MPSRSRICPTASREEVSTAVNAWAAASGLLVSTLRAAAACTPITDTWWATTSCSSRAMRSRSATTAWSRSRPLWVSMV